MKKFFDVIVVIPVCRGMNIDFVEDTIKSYKHYAQSSYKIVIMDDSHDGAGAELNRRLPELTIRYTSKSLGTMAGLYLNLAMVYKWVLQRYRFHALFKMDTDALITGEGPDESALRLFRDNPMAGVAGQYPGCYDGTQSDLRWPGDRMRHAVTIWGLIKKPRTNLLLRKLYLQALTHGYHAGESVFGGAYFMSEALLIRLDQSGLLPHHRLRSVNLGENHLFALLAKSQGFGLESLSAPHLPFACAQEGLPAAPEDLMWSNKKVIHSTRGWRELDEIGVRQFFRNRRIQEALQIPETSGTEADSKSAYNLRHE